ncbi:alpha/beta hydrolase [Candidatus Parcubacteria bacterium]|nr:alpha/beta hydrolase [Candidatus Parcubacteria bacterium]MCG2809276.1 alpha/beta hydrolase [Candidatus Portnoybacteria bacterium]
MKKQVILIHGGSTFGTDRDYLLFLRNLKIDLDRYRRTKWSDSLRRELGSKFDVLLPKMPNPMNSKYNEWKMLFKKIAFLLDDNVILIGHSLGAIFLVKYLSENNFPKKILATMLISPPYDDEGMENSLGSFILPKSLDKLNKQGGKIFVYQSKDDEVVPYSHLEKYKKALPNAIAREFKKRGHFNQPSFPELVKDIKGL